MPYHVLSGLTAALMAIIVEPDFKGLIDMTEFAASMPTEVSASDSFQSGTRAGHFKENRILATTNTVRITERLQCKNEWHLANQDMVRTTEKAVVQCFNVSRVHAFNRREDASRASIRFSCGCLR